MIELSRYVFEALRRDEDFILYRGRSKDDGSQAAFAIYGAPLILGEANVSQERRRSVSRGRVLVLSPVMGSLSDRVGRRPIPIIFSALAFFTDLVKVNHLYRFCRHVIGLCLATSSSWRWAEEQVT